MGCCASSTDNSDDEATQPVPARRNRHQGRVAPAAVADSADDSGSDSEAAHDDQRRRQEEADFMLAQLLFQEQLMLEERQQRLDRTRAAVPHSPLVPGLTDAEFARAGKVMRLDAVLLAKKSAVTSPTGKLLSPGDRRDSASSRNSWNNSASSLTGLEQGGQDNNTAALGLVPSGSSYDDCSSLVVANEAVECALCMEELAAGCELRALYCGHVYHRTCVDDWLRRKRVCPMCQRDVTLASNSNADVTVALPPQMSRKRRPRKGQRTAAESSSQAAMPNASPQETPVVQIVQGSIVPDDAAAAADGAAVADHAAVEGVPQSTAFAMVVSRPEQLHVTSVDAATPLGLNAGVAHPRHLMAGCGAGAASDFETSAESSRAAVPAGLASVEVGELQPPPSQDSPLRIPTQQRHRQAALDDHRASITSISHVHIMQSAAIAAATDVASPTRSDDDRQLSGSSDSSTGAAADGAPVPITAPRSASNPFTEPPQAGDSSGLQSAAGDDLPDAAADDAVSEHEPLHPLER